MDAMMLILNFQGGKRHQGTGIDITAVSLRTTNLSNLRMCSGSLGKMFFQFTQTARKKFKSREKQMHLKRVLLLRIKNNLESISQIHTGITVDHPGRRGKC